MEAIKSHTNTTITCHINPILHAIESGNLIELPPCGKEAALHLLANQLASRLTPATLREELFQYVMQREAQAITYLGYGIACPHARADLPFDISCIIGWSPEGIEYGNTDDWPVHLIMMFFVNTGAGNRYLTTLSSLARVIESDECKHELVNLKDLDEVRERLEEWVAAVEGRTEELEDEREMARRATCTVLSRLLMPDILEMLEARRLSDLRIFLAAQPEPEIAELITSLKDADQILIFRLLSRHQAEQVFSLLDYPAQNVLLSNMAQDETRQILAALSPDDRTALFEELPASVTLRLLNLLDQQDLKQALSLLSYPKESVGRLMTNRYVAANENWSVARTLEHIRTEGNDSETITMVYIINERGVLVDDILLRRLILADPEAIVSSLMDRQYVALHSLQDREEALMLFKKYDAYALPVVDSDGVLLGIVTNDDILDVSEEEATEDFHKVSGVRPMTSGYLRTPLGQIYRSRLPWLLALVFVNIFSGAGLAYFDKLITSYIALVFFLPLLIDSGGNAGSQSATLVIRSMALGELTLTDFVRVLWREMTISILLGLSMAAASFSLAWWRGGLRIAVVVSGAMAAIVLGSSLIGMILPFILRKLKVDPAVASSPLVTSLADIIGVFIYFGFASLLL